MKNATLAFLLSLTLSSQFAQAAPVTQLAFDGSQTVVNMAHAPTVTGPFTYQGLSFSESSTGSGQPGWRDLTGFGLGFSDNAGISNITIDLNGSYTIVGLDVHIGSATYDVSFYDSAFALIGTVSTTLGSNLDFNFVGFESAGGISRINMLETSGENFLVGGFDRIQFQNTNNVPEPDSLALLGLALGGLLLTRRKADAAKS